MTSNRRTALTMINPRDWTSHPPLIDDDYKSTALRGPTQAPIPIDAGSSETTGPTYGQANLKPHDDDMTRNGIRNGQPIGERIVVAGRVLGDNGEPIANTLIELWQANACGRYVHDVDQHDAPLDPNFLGAGRCLTDADGNYRFYTIKPGAYPWGNHHNAWRPPHIHFSVFGPSISTRLITQMYFPGDPLLALDPIFLSTPEHARDRLVSTLSLDITEPDFALGYGFDITLRGGQ